MASYVSMRKIGFSLTAVFALLFVMAPSQPAPNDRFKVQIEIDQASLDQPGFAQNGEFFVTTKVTNTSNHDEQLTAWTQAGWSWVSSDKAVAPGTEALKNYASRFVLKPDQVYSTQVEMWADRRVKGPITFRLGFVPNATSPASTNQAQINNWGGTFWSNYVTLHQ